MAIWSAMRGGSRVARDGNCWKSCGGGRRCGTATNARWPIDELDFRRHLLRGKLDGGCRIRHDRPRDLAYDETIDAVLADYSGGRRVLSCRVLSRTASLRRTAADLLSCVYAVRVVVLVARLSGGGRDSRRPAGDSESPAGLCCGRGRELRSRRAGQAPARSPPLPRCNVDKLQSGRELVAGAQAYGKLVVVDCRRSDLYRRIPLQESEGNGCPIRDPCGARGAGLARLAA